MFLGYSKCGFFSFGVFMRFEYVFMNGVLCFNVFFEFFSSLVFSKLGKVVSWLMVIYSYNLSLNYEILDYGRDLIL